MSNSLPTAADVAQLLAFLPVLYPAQPATPFRPATGQPQAEPGTMKFWPDYRPEVEAFFELAGSACWSDSDYSPEQMRDLLQQPGGVESADLMQIRSLLTFMVRGERFCDGHWGAMLEQGHVRRLLQRLAHLPSA